jgi:hypothetical protein
MTLLNVGDKICTEDFTGYKVYTITRTTDKFAIVHINNGANDGKGTDIKFKREYNSLIELAGNASKFPTYYNIVTPELIKKINHSIRSKKLSKIEWEKQPYELVIKIYDLMEQKK